jgi:hypothetical protein
MAFQFSASVPAFLNEDRRTTMKTTLRPHFRARTKFAFASTILMLSLLFALPSVRSAEELRLLYAIVDTNFDSATPPITVFDPPTLVAARLAALNDGEFRLGVIGSTRAQTAIALAICPPGGEDGLRAVAYTIANAFSPQNQLATLDLDTGEATLVVGSSPITTELDIMAMACSPDGRLYAIGQLNPTNPDFNSLYTVDRKTGSATLIGPTGVLDPSDFSGSSGFLMALAFTPDGTLYGVSDGAIGKGSALYSVSVTTGFATKVVDIKVNAVMGLAIDVDGKFYVADYAQRSKIYTLDSITGIATPILETHLDFVNNIAFKQTPR